MHVWLNWIKASAKLYWGHSYYKAFQNITILQHQYIYYYIIILFIILISQTKHFYIFYSKCANGIHLTGHIERECTLLSCSLMVDHWNQCDDKGWFFHNWCVTSWSHWSFWVLMETCLTVFVPYQMLRKYIHSKCWVKKQPNYS